MTRSTERRRDSFSFSEETEIIAAENDCCQRNSMEEKRLRGYDPAKQKGRMRALRVLLSTAMVISLSPSLMAESPIEKEWKASFAQVVRENQDAVVQVVAEVSRYEKMYHDYREPPPKERPLLGKIVGTVFSTIALVACVLPCTVVDQTMRLLCGPGEAGPKARSEGTGFTVDPEGYVLTNRHVVRYAKKVVVVFSDGTNREGEVVGFEKETDLAMIRVKLPEGERLKAAEFQDLDEVEVGDLVVAIGNPFGLTQSVTTGVVSSLRRQGPYIDYLQTDAALNPGNSGGPLLLSNGKVIGINTAVFARGQNLGFAVPSDVALAVLEQLKHGEVRRGTIGIEVRRNTSEMKERLDLKTIDGLVVTFVEPEGPAARAGIEVNDVILQVDGLVVDKIPFLVRVASLAEGEALSLNVQTGEEKRTVSVIGEPLRPREVGAGGT
jgi:serine protease Do